MLSRGLAILAFALGCHTALALSVTPLYPIPGGTNNEVSPSFNVWIDAPDTNLSVQFFCRKAPPTVRSNFTVAVLPDTQNYTASKLGAVPEMFTAQTDWIVANRARRNIEMVVHVGDIVESYDTVEHEWFVATNAMSRLEDPVTTQLPFGIPYGIAPGNHDGSPSQGYRGFNRYFGVSRFAGKPYYGGHYGTNNSNSFVLFSAAGMDFIAVFLEFAPAPPILAWANQVMQIHSHRRAILVSHSILRPGMVDVPFNAQGLPIYEAVKTNQNLFLMLCGHEPQVGVRTNTFQGNTITSVLSDFENEPNGGNGWMRLLEFSPSNNVIRVTTYSPWLNQFKTAHYQFSIPYNMSLDRQGYWLHDTIQTNGPVALHTVPVSGLAAETTYEWFVRIEGETISYTSPAWRFSTGPQTKVGTTSFAIFGASVDAIGRISFIWPSVGGRRYRVEYSDATADGGFNGQFKQIVRPEAEEIDGSSEGSVSVQTFVDDFKHTGGPPIHGGRFFRIKEIR